MREKLPKLLHKIRILLKPFLSWKVLIVYLPIYFLCTGWTFLGLISWMPTWYKIAAASWYATLWMPWMPEKLITFPLTIFLYKKIFLNPKRIHKNKKDADRIKAMEELLQQEKASFKEKIENIKFKHRQRKTKRFLKRYQRK